MSETEFLSIERVTPQQDHRLLLEFNDGTVRTVDFFPFLSQSQHPQIRAYLDKTKFASHRLEQGDLVWGDYELCFPTCDLYNNKL